MNLRLLCSVCYRTYVHYIVCIGSILFYYGFLACYSVLRPGALNGVGKSDNAFWVIFEVETSPKPFPPAVEAVKVNCQAPVYVSLIQLFHLQE